VCVGNISSTEVGMRPSAAKIELAGWIVSSAQAVNALHTSSAAERNEKPGSPVLMCVQSFDPTRPKVFRAGCGKFRSQGQTAIHQADPRNCRAS